MGQDVSKCACAGLCAPEDPAVEQNTQMNTRGTPPPPGTSECEEGLPNGFAGRGGRAAAVVAQSGAARSGDAAGGRTPRGNRFGAAPGWGGAQAEQDDEGFFLPPPAPDATPTAPAEQVPSRPRPAEASPAVRSDLGPPELDLGVILLDLFGSEVQAYGRAFDSVAGRGKDAQPDNPALRDLVVANSAIQAAELDTELLKIASTRESFGIDRDSFLCLLREHAVAEGDALQQFVSMTHDGETIAAEDCRSGLLNLMQQRLNVVYSDDLNERVFDTVMTDAGLTVNMEQWIAYCKMVARIVRVAKYCQAA